MIETILLPTDGSKGAKRGMEQALDLAEEHGADLHVLFVVDERIYGRTPALSSDEFFLERLEEEGTEICRAVAEAAGRRGIETVTECIRGDPRVDIAAYAEDNDVDLIVMGVHGVGGGRRPHLDGATDRVVRTAPCEVRPV